MPRSRKAAAAVAPAQAGAESRSASLTSSADSPLQVPKAGAASDDRPDQSAPSHQLEDSIDDGEDAEAAWRGQREAAHQPIRRVPVHQEVVDRVGPVHRRHDGIHVIDRESSSAGQKAEILLVEQVPVPREVVAPPVTGLEQPEAQSIGVVGNDKCPATGLEQRCTALRTFMGSSTCSIVAISSARSYVSAGRSAFCAVPRWIRSPRARPAWTAHSLVPRLRAPSRVPRIPAEDRGWKPSPQPTSRIRPPLGNSGTTAAAGEPPASDGPGGQGRTSRSRNRKRDRWVGRPGRAPKWRGGAAGRRRRTPCSARPGTGRHSRGTRTPHRPPTGPRPGGRRCSRRSARARATGSEGGGGASTGRSAPRAALGSTSVGSDITIVVPRSLDLAPRDQPRQSPGGTGAAAPAP